MTNSTVFNVLHIDLADRKTYTKTYTELGNYIGGVGLSSKLILDNYEKDPLVMAVGPLSGIYPFASKTCVSYIDKNRNFSDNYIGGRLATRIKFTNLDALVFENSSKEELSIYIKDNQVIFASNDTDMDALSLPGRKATFVNSSDNLLLDNYFGFENSQVKEVFDNKGISVLTISSTNELNIENQLKYEKKYHEILDLKNKMLVPEGNYPSCSGCPMGCFKSKEGEIGGNYLVHSLVACIYSQPIFTNVSNVFSCLNSIGYDYTHEELEKVSNLVFTTVKAINEKSNSSQLEAK